MKKFLKIISVILGLIVAIMLIVPVALSGKIEEIVKREANNMLNAKVEFSKLDISLLRHFPKASVGLSGLSVVGVEAFEGQTLVAADKIEVAVDLFSLFGDSFEISKVWLLSPEIYGVVAKDGAVNWDIMKSDGEEEEEVEEESSSSFSLSLRSLAIEDAKIYYTDNQSAMHFHTAPASLHLSGDLSAATTTLALQAAAGDITFVSGKESYASGLTATLDGSVVADLENDKYTLNGLQLSVNSVKAALDGWVQLEGDDIVTDINLDCSGNNFKNILSLVPAFYTTDFKNLTAAGDVSLTGDIKGRMSGENYPAFNLNMKVAGGSFKYADLPKSVTDINIVAAVANRGGSLDATTVDVSRFGASFGGQSFSATLKASTPLSDLNFAATAKGKVDLGAIKDIYPLEDMALAGIITADASAAGRLSDIDKGAYDRLAVSGQLGVESIEVEYGSLPTIGVKSALATLSPSKMALENLDITIGKSDISAKGSLTNYWGYLLHDKTLSGNLSVNSTLLDLNEIMASMAEDEEQTEQTENTEQTEEGADEPMTVIEVPKNLDLALSCKFDKVLYDKMVIDNLAGAATVRGGELSLNNLIMNMFDGAAKASALYSTADVSNPRLRLNANFSEASFKTTAAQVEMITKMVPLFEKIEGTYTMALNCNMLLDSTMSPVLKSVNGNGKITSGNFKLSNIPAFTALAKVVGNGIDLNTIQTSEATVISFTIEDGNIVTQPFDIKLGKTKLTLSGLTGLDQSIDYKVAVALPQVTLHAKIGGTFTSPKIGLDTAKSAEAVLEKAGIDKQQVVEQVEQKVDTAKQELIAEAEARAAQIIATARTEADKLVAKASNPIAKVAAKAAADKLIAEAERKAAQIVEEARNK
ncbi:MAG: AsmA family protein [Alistipes sp.]|nr:AsmA family protein [Alistipes sp.]